MKKLLLSLLSVFIAIVIVKALKAPDSFHYERSGLISAPSEKIFPYLVDFKLGGQWSPYERKDPSMKRNYSGPATGIGSIMEFEGSKETGSGRLEIKGLIPNQKVELELHMLKPFEAMNQVIYELKPEGGSTRFTWAMNGKNNLIGKLLSVFMDCEKLVTPDFEAGIQNLKTIAEKPAL